MKTDPILVFVTGTVLGAASVQAHHSAAAEVLTRL